MKIIKRAAFVTLIATWMLIGTGLVLAIICLPMSIVDNGKEMPSAWFWCLGVLPLYFFVLCCLYLYDTQKPKP